VLKRVAAVVLALAAATTACGGDRDVVDRALDRLDDDDEFDTAFEAGDSLARIGGMLQAEGEVRSSEPLLSASAYAQVLAVRVLDCTAPGRHEAREAMRTFLHAVADVDDDARAPQPPPAPDCR
jgi:hypothetical protein